MCQVNKMNLEKYDLVLMDIVMPNLDGKLTCYAVKHQSFLYSRYQVSLLLP